MNTDSLLKASGIYFDKLRCPENLNDRLVDTICRIRPDCADYAETWMANAIHGRELGCSMMKPFENVTLNPNKFFCYGNPLYNSHGSRYDRREFDRLAMLYKENLPSFYEDAKDRELVSTLIAGNAQALDRDFFPVIFDESLKDLRNLTAEQIRDKYAHMLEAFWNYDHMSSADQERLDIAFAASLLLAGLDEGLYTAQDAHAAASQLGLVIGAVREGTRQAANAYDRPEQKSRDYDRDLLIFGVTGELAIIAAIGYGHWIWPLAKEAAVPLLSSNPVLILIGIALAITVFLLLYVPATFIDEARTERKIALRIAREGCDRAQSVLQPSSVQNDSESENHCHSGTSAVYA